MLILVTAILFLGSEAKSKSDWPVSEADPAGFTCYDETEIHDIAVFKKSCDLAEKNLETMKEQYGKCLSINPCEKSWTDSRAVFWGSVLSALVVGFIAGNHH